MKLLCILITLFIFSCSTSVKKSEYALTASEVAAIMGADNLTDEQKIILTHAAANLKNADAMSLHVEQLQKKLADESKLAGAGRLSYILIIMVMAVLAGYVSVKILKLFKP